MLALIFLWMKLLLKLLWVPVVRIRPNPTSAARSTNPFDPTEEEEDAIDPETQDESLKEQQRPFGYPSERDIEEDILIHVCTQVLQIGTDFQAWLQAEGITNVATLLSYDLDDYAASGFDIPRPLYKMICALAHWYLHDPSAINEGDDRLFFPHAQGPATPYGYHDETQG